MFGAKRYLTCWVIIAVLAVEFIHAERTGMEEADTPLSRSKREAKCHAKFRVNSGHTACLPGSDASVVTSEEKQAIVDIHNEFRAGVTPTASNMMKLRWDDEVAMVAQKWAENCHFGHDGNNKRNIPGRLEAGQNVALGHQTWKLAIVAWHSEVSVFTYNDKTMNNKLIEVGHYTQMVWAKTTLIGCGMQKCNDGNLYVCNYAEPGNYKGQLHVPYKSGSSCADCSGHCSGGSLCDCQLTCYNRGRLLPDKCTCECRVTPDLYQPPDCSLNCTGADKSFPCDRSGECPRDINACPHLCNICPTAGVDYKGSGGSKVTGHDCLLPCLTLLLLQLLLHLTL